MKHRIFSVAAIGMLAIGAVACGSDDTVVPSDSTEGLPTAACLAGDEDCYETGGEAPSAPPTDDASDVTSDTIVGEDFDIDPALERANAILGVAESELPDDVRIARRGDEQFPLTEDYRLGRITVELDEIDGEFRVATASVELPGGLVNLEADQS